MNYRKKPVQVEARIATHANVYDIVNWIEENGGMAVIHLGPDFLLAIETLEGTMNVSSGDYIIRGVKGEFYPCKPDIFHETYEKM